MPADNVVKQKLLQPTADNSIDSPKFYVVVTEAVKVKGLKVTITFDKKTAPEVKAKFPTQALSLPFAADATVGAQMEWTDELTMVISTDAEFFVAGVLRKYDPKAGLNLKPTDAEMGGNAWRQLIYRAKQRIP